MDITIHEQDGQRLIINSRGYHMLISLSISPQEFQHIQFSEANYVDFFKHKVPEQIASAMAGSGAFHAR